jgi:signal transduction histidine kinase
MAADADSFPARVGAACHDLRTPLATVFGFARTLERQGGLDERQARYVEMIIAGADDLNRLIEDLAVVARIEAGSFAARHEAVDPRALASEAAAELGGRLGSAREVGGPSGRADRAVRTDRKLAVAALASLAEAGLRRQRRKEEVGFEIDSRGAVEFGPLADGFALLEGDGRDLHLSAARAVLGELGARLEAVGDRIRVTFPATA